MERIKAAIIEAEKAARASRAELEKARRAGINVTEQEKKLAEVEINIARMRSVYIEGR